MKFFLLTFSLFLSTPMFAHAELDEATKRRFAACKELVGQAVLNTAINTMFGRTPTKKQLEDAQQSVGSIRQQFIAMNCNTGPVFDARYEEQLAQMNGTKVKPKPTTVSADRQAMTAKEAADYDRWLQAEGKYITGDTSIAPGRETPTGKSRPRKAKTSGAQ